MPVTIDTWAQKGVRVRAWRSARKGRIGTVVSHPSFATYTSDRLEAQIRVKYDGGDAPPLWTFVFCLEPLSAVELLGELA